MSIAEQLLQRMAEADVFAPYGDDVAFADKLCASSKDEFKAKRSDGFQYNVSIDNRVSNLVVVATTSLANSTFGRPVQTRYLAVKGIGIMDTKKTSSEFVLNRREAFLAAVEATHGTNVRAQAEKQFKE